MRVKDAPEPSSEWRWRCIVCSAGYGKASFVWKDCVLVSSCTKFGVLSVFDLAIALSCPVLQFLYRSCALNINTGLTAVDGCGTTSCIITFCWKFTSFAAKNRTGSTAILCRSSLLSLIHEETPVSYRTLRLPEKGAHLPLSVRPMLPMFLELFELGNWGFGCS